MIRRIAEKSRLSVGSDYYRLKICSYMDAYGGDYGFCRFYCEGGSLSGGNVLLLNSSAVIGGVFTDNYELEEFITMNAPDTVECPSGTAARLSLPEYERQRRVLFRLPVSQNSDWREFEKDLDEPVSLHQMFMILNACFTGLSFEGWYTDMSHRVRHEISKVYTYKCGVCASVDFKGSENAFISSIAVVPAMRGNGYGEKMLGYVARELKKSKLRGFLWADGNSEGYYNKLGFSVADEDVFFVRKSSSGR